MDIWAVGSSEPLGVVLFGTGLHTRLWVDMFRIRLGAYPGAELPGHRVCRFSFSGSCQMLPTWWASWHSHQLCLLSCSTSWYCLLCKRCDWGEGLAFYTLRV